MISGTLRLPGVAEIDLDATLRSGQLFRWTQDADGSWQGTIGADSYKLAQSESGETLFWEGPSERAVRSFLRLDDFSLAEAAEGWSSRDPLFAEAWALQPGVRILRQDPTECLFSFLCASVAPIARISSMLRGIAPPGVPFPAPADLARLSESHLRALGLGFRAPRILAAAGVLAADPSGSLEALRGRPLIEIEASLSAHSGIGRKIADCIALFSLDADGAVPVDTHIWQIARAHYAPHLAGRALTPGTYQNVVDAFQERFGERSGWAQQILFYRRAVGDRAR